MKYSGSTGRLAQLVEQLFYTEKVRGSNPLAPTTFFYMNIPILFEDDDLVVINKPSGVVVHGDGKSAEPTVADWFAQTYPKSIEVGEPAELSDGTIVPRPGIVHRLDADTSGALILAKTQEAYTHLKAQFQERKMKKVYIAFVYGNVRDDRGIINRPIGKSRRDPRLRTAMRGARGMMRDAITHYRVVTRGDGVTELELRPKTGRTHQIRVHMQSMNHPVVCDPLYAPDREPLLGFGRLALHARSLSFTTPQGKELLIEAPLPEDFVRGEALIGEKA